jgi:hypothetical protein
MTHRPYTLFGIRHHGPGSAVNLVRALEKLAPDAVLVEGPPDADALIPLAGHAGMRPPVALLVYDKARPIQSVFYPFAEFSPEWQAIQYALSRDIPVKFMDLPQAHRFSPPAPEPVPETDEPSAGAATTDSLMADSLPAPDEGECGDIPSPADPLDWFARHAGYEDGESWWEHAIEERLDPEELFRAVADAMISLREQFPSPSGSVDESRLEERREAWMRKTIRETVKQGFGNIAVICGAWHVPALFGETKVKNDNALLKGLTKVKVEATWVPWTYNRLARRSGYGAGIHSPGWYHHLWDFRRNHSERSATSLSARWMIAAAGYLREADLDASSAHVIEAIRLAESLSSLRQRPFSGLRELDEAIRTVLCFGNSATASFIKEPLYIGERMGATPPETPKVPLQTELESLQKSLQLKVRPTAQELDLDLRTPAGLRRSHLLHRLNLLNIPWGKPMRGDYGKKGTFHEFWQIKWEPEFPVAIIEASIWGATVESAATARAVHTAHQDSTLAALSDLVHAVILSELPGAVGPVVQALQSRCGQSNDVAGLMQSLSSLVRILRYGNVRQSDTSMVAHVVDGIVSRICIGLGPACQSLDEDASRDMNAHIASVNHAIRLTENTDHLSGWTLALNHLTGSATVHALIQGKACRLLFDGNSLLAEDVARLMSLALSPGNDPAMAAAWIEGFLEGSGMILVHDRSMWDIVDTWLGTLPDERFTGLLPLIRRTFSTFSPPERFKLGEMAKHEKNQGAAIPAKHSPDRLHIPWGDRAALSAARLMGLTTNDEGA